MGRRWQQLASHRPDGLGQARLVGLNSFNRLVQFSCWGTDCRQGWQVLRGVFYQGFLQVVIASQRKILHFAEIDLVSALRNPLNVSPLKGNETVHQSTVNKQNTFELSC